VVLASGWGTKGRTQKYVDSKEILNYGFAHYSYEDIITAETLAGTMPITRSRTPEVEYAYADSLRLPLNAEEKQSITVKLHLPDNIKAPVHTGDWLGNAHIYIGDTAYTQIALTATADAARHDYKTSLEKILNAFIGQITNKPVDIILPEPAPTATSH